MPRRALQAIVCTRALGLITHGTFAGTGDEPHYLAITHSIAFDGDLDLANNYGANEPLVGGGVLSPERTCGRAWTDVARPVHDVGHADALRAGRSPCRARHERADAGRS